MEKLKILIAGSTGYIGTELIKILLKHKFVKIKYLCGIKVWKKKTLLIKLLNTKIYLKS